MFKSPRYLLSAIDQPPNRIGARWGIRAHVVVGRHMCVHVLLDARGVPRRSTSAFVALQGPRHAPFASAAGAYLRQGDVVHLWAWPQSLQDDLQQQLRVTARRLALIPESMLGTPAPEGVVLRTCVVGLEALRFQRGLLVDAAWWPEAPDTETVRRWGAGAPLIEDLQPATERAASARPWSRAWGRWPEAARQTAASATLRHLLASPVSIAGWLALALSAVMAGWSFEQNRLALAAVEQSQQALDQALARVSSLARSTTAPSSAGKRLADLTPWLTQARSATRSLQLQKVWIGLAQSLAAGGFLVREFAFERDEVKLTLVSGFGIDVDLAGAVSALEKSGLWTRVEIVDLSNAAVVRLALTPNEDLFESAAP